MGHVSRCLLTRGKSTPRQKTKKLLRAARVTYPDGCSPGENQHLDRRGKNLYGQRGPRILMGHVSRCLLTRGKSTPRQKRKHLLRATRVTYPDGCSPGENQHLDRRGKNFYGQRGSRILMGHVSRCLLTRGKSTPRQKRKNFYGQRGPRILGHVSRCLLTRGKSTPRQKTNNILRATRVTYPDGPRIPMPAHQGKINTSTEDEKTVTGNAGHVS
jgi:hypothetical protein